MSNTSADMLDGIFPFCRRTLGRRTWGRVLAALGAPVDPPAFPRKLIDLQEILELPDFIGDLARIEWARHRVEKDATALLPPQEKVVVNPSLTLVPVSWENLVALMDMHAGLDAARLEPAAAHVMIWRHPQTDKLRLHEAQEIDLLALKLTVEQIDPRQAAPLGKVTVGVIHEALNRAVALGTLLAPASRIHRTGVSALPAADDLKPFLAADTFTLQWHITQACDLHCKHCYDRSDRAPMPYADALAILEDFYDFCRQMHVRGQVTFTGGNPLLYPHIEKLYQAATDRGFGIAILGNPGPIEPVERLCRIAKPSYFQISLEGLAHHNDYIRGQGHFQRSLIFLDQLRELEIFTMVMLTLTRDNLDHVLPLSRQLAGRVDAFNFNRLSTVGEGANLLMPAKADFQAFLGEYVRAAAEMSHLGLKDNLINIVRTVNGHPPFGGCTGYGCGVAFNFVAVLPDGEVHACRKFPSPLGNMLQTSLLEIYHSKLAHQYRSGSQACRECRLSLVCRGCLAITHSHGLDVFKEKDPFCFAPQEFRAATGGRPDGA